MPSPKIFFDGGCRPNPGRLETAVVVRGIAYVDDDLGEGSNTDAEWLAAIAALQVALALGERDVRLLGDSAVVVGQANGTRRCRTPELEAYRDRFRDLASRFASVRVRQIGRAQNLAGIALDRRRR
ncbi:reverse transcriptase-like protein [Sphingomonas ginsenosidivorax]|uniref:Reverse transcriptase-like protein n=1 Tax=Sphingomonas ginsenosidivorax TaxID=862135 RepID=A0A5C6UDI8_9SPHN|nr:reverse transcriptase-like protein [Sphingomonas ginsenosidivorax]TXC70729.1 reverse transcriptase-like protein [Sphingomonas ginsenosidivorax]